MNTTTKVIAGVAILALLFVGVGYALTYHATTTVTDNTIETRYIEISMKCGDSADYTDILGTVDYDTVNDAGTTKYSPINDVRVDGATIDSTHPADAQTISTADWKVIVEKTGFDAEQNYNLIVTASNFTPVGGLTYTMKVGDKTADYADGAWTFTGLTTSSTPLDVVMYISGTATTSSETAGFTNGSTVFTFEAQAEA